MLFRSIDDDIKAFVIKNLELVKSYIADDKVIGTLDELPQAMFEAMQSNELKHQVDNGSAYIVSIEGNNYAVLHNNKSSVMTSEELPDFLRKGIGMLKLVQDHEMISNIGVKADEFTFAIFERKENENEIKVIDRKSTRLNSSH